MFNLFRKKNKFFTDEEHHAFVKAIRHTEKKPAAKSDYTLSQNAKRRIRLPVPPAFFTN
jgi:hypothetical protein